MPATSRLDRDVSDPRADILRRGYATVASAYREHLQDELAGKPLDRALLGAFAEQTSGRIADIGCGPGHVARYLADRGVTVEGLDLSPAMIAEAQASHPALTFREGDMFALPYEDGALGGIVAFYAIVHVQTAELATPLREFHRVLATGGLALLAFHAGEETNHVTELFGCPTALDFMFHPPEAVATALVEAGFAIAARLERTPDPAVEYPSLRTYLLARKR
jgi:SAM-dependent methyltransferase